MKLRTILETLTTKPNEYTKKYDSKNIKEYEFDFKDIEGETRSITVGLVAIKEIFAYGVNIYEVDFEEKSSEDYEATNYGNADVVFATIIDIVKNFLLDKSIDGVAFRDLKEGKRMKIYKILSNQFLGSEFEKIQGTIYEDEFIFIVRKEKKETLLRAIKKFNKKGK